MPGPKPDLILPAVSTTTTVLLPGDNLRIASTVTNQGTAKADAFTIAFHPSANAVYGDSDDIDLVATRSLSRLTIGSSNSSSTDLTVSAATTPGNYYICAQADSADTVDEGAFEDNNARCTDAPLAVTYPDLIMTDVTPAVTSANQGTYISANSTVSNQGLIPSGASKVGFLLSLNQTHGDADDIPISTIHLVSSLNAGDSSTATTSIKLPTGITPDDYYLCAVADSADAVAEMDENNNGLCSASVITVLP